MNDQAPCFSQSSYDFIVNDEMRPQQLIGSVVAVDRDQDPSITYHIVEGNEAGLFAVNSEGILKFNPKSLVTVK